MHLMTFRELTDQTAKQIQNTLKENNIQFDEESQADPAHEFPSDFEKSFHTAIDFIFKEQE